jgi:histidinol-phosphate aminotransferase
MAFSVRDILRRDLAGLVPYEVASPKNSPVKLDANENPFDFPPALREEIYERLRKSSLNRYPDPLAGELREVLSRYTGVPAERIMAGNGSDELILNLALTFGTGGRVVIATPTFSMYRVHSLIAGAEPVEVPRLQPGFALDLDSLQQAAAAKETRLVFLCSPNNPTGNPAPLDEVAAVLEKSRALVVVDEAYIEFGGETCLPLLAGYPNLVILRTFSKAFGLAGLRIGYLLGDRAVVRELFRVKQPFNLSTFAQVAACTALAHREEFSAMVARILEAREWLAKELASLPGVTVYPSSANFLLFRTPLPADFVFRRLLEEGVLIRNLHGPGLEGCLRVTVGRKEENEIFLEKMKAVLAAS